MSKRATNCSVSSTVEAELHSSAALIQLIKVDVRAPHESVIRNDHLFRLDLSLNPRLANSRFNFPERWSADRYRAVGELFLLPPGQTLQVKSGTGLQHFLLCHLPVAVVEKWLEEEIEWTDQNLEAGLDIVNHTIRSLMMQLGHEARYPGFASRVMIEALAMQIVVSLQREFIGRDVSLSIGGLAPWRLKLIDQRLGDIDESPTLAELAALCKLSVRQLSRGFRVSRGVAIGEYISCKQIEKAKRLLATQSVKSIAYSMGFNSTSSFSYAFRRSTGITPTQYREQIWSISPLAIDDV